MKRRPGLNLVERAVIAQQWRHTALEAQLLAMCSLDADKLVNKAGKMVYVVLGACITEKFDAEMLEMRILRGAVNAIHDQAGETVITPMRRKSIEHGLTVAASLIPQLPRKALVDAACDLELKLRTGHVHLSDFEDLTKEITQ